MKSILQKVLLAALLITTSQTIVAQIKIDNKVNVARKAAAAEKRLKEMAEKKAAADKILNATLVKVQIVISKQNRRAKSVFSKMFFGLNKQPSSNIPSFIPAPVKKA